MVQLKSNIKLQQSPIFFICLNYLKFLDGKHFLQRKTPKLGLTLKKRLLKSPKSMWEIVWWSVQAKVEFSGHNFKSYIWCKNNTARREESIIPIVKQGGGSIMLCDHFSITRTGSLVKVEGIMNSSKYKSMLAQNVRLLLLSWRWRGTSSFTTITTQSIISNQQKASPED